MKTLRYMLIIAALLSVLSIEAHMFDKNWGQKPVVEMHSTSAMAYVMYLKSRKKKEL